MSGSPRQVTVILAGILIAAVACGGSESTTADGDADYEPRAEECGFTEEGAIEGFATIEELARFSSLIVVGTITEALPPAWGPEVSSQDGSIRYIETYFVVRVEEELRGDPGDTLIVLQPGGSIDGCTQTIAPKPHLAVDQRVLLFLSYPAKRPQGMTYSVTGGDQGYWPINEDNIVRPRVAHFAEYGGLSLEQIANQIGQ